MKTTLEERIQKDRELIDKAKAEGRDTTEWELHLDELERKKAVQDRLFQYLCDKVTNLNCDGDQEKLKAFLDEWDRINSTAYEVIEGKGSFDEWKTLVDRWISLMDNSYSFRCSICGICHGEVAILLDITYFKEEMTVCNKCYKRLN